MVIRMARVFEQGTLDFMGETMSSEKPVFTDPRIKCISENVFECLLDRVECRHKFPFGYKNICSWLLKNASKGLDHKLPCPESENAEKQEQHDGLHDEE